MTPPYDRPVHKVTVKEGTLLADIIGAGEHGVNSYHHQAVKDLAPKAEAMAYSGYSGIRNLLLKKIRSANSWCRRLWMPAKSKFDP